MLWDAIERLSVIGTTLHCHNLLLLADQLVGLFAVLSAGLLNSALDLAIVRLPFVPNI